jgi:hypothetical protein
MVLPSVDKVADTSRDKSLLLLFDFHSRTVTPVWLPVQNVKDWRKKGDFDHGRAGVKRQIFSPTSAPGQKVARGAMHLCQFKCCC